MANAGFATGSQGAAAISRTERVSARPKGASVADIAGFNRSLDEERSESVNAALRFHPTNDKPATPGGGLLGSGVAFLLAETRTQEASAPLPPISNFEMARNRYLATQAQVRDTVAANQILRGEVNLLASDAGDTQYGHEAAAYDDDIEEAEAPRPRYGANSLI